MTDLTKLTLAEAREGLKKKDFSATEITRAFLAAIEAGNKALNAYVLPTPEHALNNEKAAPMPRSKSGRGAVRMMAGSSAAHSGRPGAFI